MKIDWNSVRLQMLLPTILTLAIIIVAFKFFITINDLQSKLAKEFEQNQSIQIKNISAIANEIRRGHFAVYQSLSEMSTQSPSKQIDTAEVTLTQHEQLLNKVTEKLTLYAKDSVSAELLGEANALLLDYDAGVHHSISSFFEQPEESYPMMVLTNDILSNFNDKLTQAQAKLSEYNASIVHSMRGQTQEQLFTFASIQIITGIIIFALGLLFYLSLTSSIQSIIKGVKGISAKNVKARLPAQKIKELDILSHAFNKMTTELESYQTILGEQIKEMESAKEIAEKASIVKSEFLGNISHEIRTPVNAMVGSASMLLDSQLNEEQMESVKYIDSSAQNLLNIVDDILSLTKIETGQYHVENILFELDKCINTSFSMFTLRAHSANIELILDYPIDLPSHLIGDPTRLRQLLNNLLSNALKYTEQGQIMVRIRLEKHIGENIIIKIEVIDSGIGISEENQERVFAKIQQGSNANMVVGLASCKSMVESLGGRIGVISEKGKGSNFWFTIPFTMGSHDKNQKIHIPAKLHNENIMVVDDNHYYLRMMKLHLESWKIKHHAEDSAEGALNALREAEARGVKVTMMLIDQEFPGMSGEALAKAIIADESIPTPMMLLLVANQQRAKINEYKKAGFAGYLIKPFFPADLLYCVAEMMNARDHNEKNIFVTRFRDLETTQDSIVDYEEVADKKKILIVEDNDINMRVCHKILSKLDCEIFTQTNGKECLDFLEEESVDLIVMDCEMPEMDGFEATRIIRQSTAKAYNKVPIIALTAHAMKGDREKCLAAGMDDYLTKPLDKAALLEKVQSYLNPVDA